VVGYPKEQEYHTILDRTTSTADAAIEKVSNGKEVLELRAIVRAVPVPDHAKTYAVRLVMATQPKSEYAPAMVNDMVALGSSPRGAQALLLGAKVQALLHGRFAVAAEDIVAVAPAVLRHRVMTNFRAHSQAVSAEDVVQEVLAKVQQVG
jgi:MoxR-like ATPase